MGEKAEATTRTYRMVRWIWLMNAGNGLFFLFISFIALALGAWTFKIGMQPVPDAGTRTNGFLLAVGVLLAGLALFAVSMGIFLIAFAVGQGALSYLRTSPEGLEYRAWPLYKVRCRWEDVDRVVHHPPRLGIKAVELRLTQGEKSGPKWAWWFVFSFRRFLGMGTELTIPLSTFRGWQEGMLADDLREKAPYAFESSVES
jgi:hypothetical protein